MPLTVTLDLSEADLDHFREAMLRLRQREGGSTSAQTTAAAVRAVSRLRSTARSPFILRRIERVGRLAAMLDDPQWALSDVDRRRVLEGLAYVAAADDLVPDGVPVLGLLDDAIMLELVLRDLRHELDAFEEFDAYRREEVERAPAAGGVTRQDWLDAQREILHARMRDRRERDLARHGGSFNLITHF